MRVLEKEVNMIQNKSLHDAAKLMLADIGPALARLPSSTTGKNHPRDERRPGGLVLHVRRMVWGALAVSRQFNLSPVERDCMITAALFHDAGLANCKTREQRLIHADVSAGIFASYIVRCVSPELLASEIKTVQGLIRTHGSHWYPFNEQPETQLQTLFSALDYIVSRSSVKINPDGET